MDDPYAESSRNASDEARVTPAEGSSPTPRWVKVFGAILILVLLLFVIMLFTRGPHGPGRHLRPGDGRDQTPNAERSAQP
ncbi:MAG TPA: hypothetical protein VJV03_05655 [Pyrinomonadaceae bacterium]|nr:hypothetical protein [Pyrinomonadaceae bacterium]